MPSADSGSTCRSSTARTRSTSSRTGRSAKCASSIRPTGSAPTRSRPADSSTASPSAPAAARAAGRTAISICATASRARWTVRGGMDQFWRDTLPALSHPYVGVAGSIGNAWAVELEGVAAAVVRGVARYEPSQYIRISTEFDHFATGLGAADPHAGRPAEPVDDQRHRSRPFRRRDNLYLDATLDRVAATTGDVTSGRLGRFPVRGTGAPGARRSGSPASAIRSAWSRASRSCRSTRCRCRSPRSVRCSGACPDARCGKATPTAAPPRWPRTCRGELGRAINLEAGCGLDPRRRHHDIAVPLDAAAVASGHDQRQRAAPRPGRRQPVRAGLAAVRSRQSPDGVHQRALGRAGGRERAGVPGREQRRALAER